MKFRFQTQYPFEARYNESTHIKSKYPNRIPIIVEQGEKSNIPDIDKHKFLVPGDMTVGQFIYIIRKRIKLNPDQAIFIFVNNVLPPTSHVISTLYQEHKNEDGFLYISYTGESTFG